MNETMDNYDELPKEIMKSRLEWYTKKYGPYIGNRGAHNWKNLFRKPTMLEWTILFMLVMGLFAAWAYKTDMQACISNSCDVCKAQTQIVIPNKNPMPNLIFKEENLTDNKSG